MANLVDSFPRLLLIILLSPVMSCICLHFAVSDTINDQTLGVVNLEVNNSDVCFNDSLVTTKINNFDCMISKVSCSFIKNFDQKAAKLVTEFKRF
jgi:hypothetical protein